MDDKTRKYLIKYMKKTGRTKTLEVLKRTSPQKQKDERKAPLKLSFQIIKASERKEIVEVKKPKQEKMKNSKDGIGLDDFEKKKKGLKQDSKFFEVAYFQQRYQIISNRSYQNLAFPKNISIFSTNTATSLFGK